MSDAATRVADSTGNWVDTHAPRWLRPYLRLSRFDRPIGAWLLLLPCWWSAALAAGVARDLSHLPLTIALFFVGAFVMRGAGCTWNDITDRKLDALVERTRSRPIPAGQVSVLGALVFLGVQALIGLAVLLQFNRFAVLTGIASLAIVAIYPFMKRITWWPQAWLGLTFNWGAPLGYAAATGTFSWSAALLYASGFFWTLGYDTIYAVQDMEDDALVGVKSSALRLGDKAPSGVRVFYWLCGALAVAAGALGRMGPLFVPLASLYGVLLLRQAARLDISDGPLALKLFKSNRDAGLILFVAFIAGLWRHGGVFGLGLG